MLTAIGVAIALPVLALLVGIHRQRKRDQALGAMNPAWLNEHAYDKDGYDK